MRPAKVTLKRNSAFVRDGVKAYARYLSRWAATPTLEGPFTLVHEVLDDGFHGILDRFHHQKQESYVRTRPVLLKRNVDGRPGRLAAEDVEHDSEYLAPVAIGSPPQILHLDFDTGSSDLWVWSELLSNSIKKQGAQDGHRIFDPLESTTYRKLPKQTWKIRYGDGSTASGEVGSDNVDIGGLVIRGQAVELATRLSDSFLNGAGDGLLGLAFVCFSLSRYSFT